MATIGGKDVTESPEVDTSDPAGSLMSILMYVVSAGMIVALYSIGSETVAPWIQSVFGTLTGGMAGDNSGGLAFGGE